MNVYQLQEALAWINIRAIEEAVNDMKQYKGFDQTTNQTRLAELKMLIGRGFNDIYTNQPAALETANKALKLKRDILLANPELDVDKLIVGRYKIGTTARQATPRALGTQNNNWSNQTSAPVGALMRRLLSCQTFVAILSRERFLNRLTVRLFLILNCIGTPTVFCSLWLIPTNAGKCLRWG